MTRPGIEPRSPGPLANTLTAWPIYVPFSKILFLVNIIIVTTVFYHQFVCVDFSFAFLIVMSHPSTYQRRQISGLAVSPEDITSQAERSVT